MPGKPRVERYSKATIHRAIDHVVLTIVLICLLAACEPNMKTHQHPSITSDPVTMFKVQVEALREKYAIPGLSLVVLHRRQVLCAEGFGYADLEKRLSATPETPYHLASLTKPFSAAVLVKLEQEGRLNLDAELAVVLENKVITRGNYTFHGYADACRQIRAASQDPSLRRYASLIDDFRCDSQRITVRHLLTHTAQGVPGETYRYNGFLFGLLASVAEVAAGKPFDQLLVETIIQPLDMDRTIPTWDERIRDRVMIDRATYYRKAPDGFVPSEYRTRLSASAGMVSTVMDLAKFDQAMDRDLIVSQASKAAMFTAARSTSGQPLPYGLGWFVQEHNGMKLVWHYGHAPRAYSSLVLKCLDRDATLILLANSEGASAPFDLGAGDVMRSPFASAFIAFTDHLASAP